MPAKRNKKKFYAVAVGKIPGIYTEWYGDKGAEIQVKGVSGAIFQGFVTKKDAQEFLKQHAGRMPAKSRAASPAKKRKSAAGVKGNATPVKSRPRDNLVTIYTDGGCLNNPGPGGYGVVIKNGKDTKELSGGYRLTTNNRMELMACIAGLSSLEKPSTVILYSDSQYVVNGITKGWAERWRANGWMKRKKEKAVNPDLWEQLLDLCEKHDVNFQWVKGHAGNEGNERCDRLANVEAAKRGLPADRGYEKEH